MKKLLIAFVACAMATVASAATVKWNGSNVYEMGSDTLKAGANYVAYFVNSADLSQSNLAANYIIDGKIDVSFLATTSAADGYSKAFTSSKGAGTGATLGGTLTTTAGNSESWTGYLVILNGPTIAESTFAYISSEVTKATGATGQQATLSFTSNTGTQDASNWVEIAPEPTSGLMMLLGMGVLALRRRRA